MLYLVKLTQEFIDDSEDSGEEVNDISKIAKKTSKFGNQSKVQQPAKP